MSKINLSPEDIASWCLQYSRLQTLPSSKIPCSSCKEGVTMFSTNLHGRVEKYGGIEKLLANFLCRACKKDDKKVHINDRKIKITTEQGNVIESIPTVEYKPRIQIHGSDLPKHKELVVELTQGTCWYPNIFLNSNKVCDTCHINVSCVAKCKKFSRHMNLVLA